MTSDDSDSDVILAASAVYCFCMDGNSKFKHVTIEF